MNTRLITVDRSFREQVLATFPGLKRNGAYWRLATYLLFPPFVEQHSRAVLLSWETLASIEGKTHQVHSRNYNGLDFIQCYQRDTGHQFAFIPHSYHEGRVRTVPNLNLHQISRWPMIMNSAQLQWTQSVLRLADE